MLAPMKLALSLLTAVLSMYVVSCSSFSGDSPALQGTVRGDNPQAAALFENGRRWEAVGEKKKALKSYGSLLSRYPADKRASDARFREAVLYNEIGDPRRAFDSYQWFIESYPDSTRFAEAVAQQEAVARAAAEGSIRTSFLGLKSRLDRKIIIGMLSKVRDNAPRANSASNAQYLMGRLNETRKRPVEAIVAYEKLIDEYPNASKSPDAQFRVGEILLKQSYEGNRDRANLDRARDAYQDLLLAYPDSSFSPQAKQRIASIGSQDLKATYNVAEFYRKKGERDSAAFYYQEVIDRAEPSDLKNQAIARLAQMKQ